MESEPSKQEPERPEAHPGSGDEADAREPHGDLLRAKTDLPAEGKTQGMQQGDQSEDDPRDEEERLLMRHRDLPSLLVWPTAAAQVTESTRSVRRGRPLLVHFFWSDGSDLRTTDCSPASLSRRGKTGSLRPAGNPHPPRAGSPCFHRSLRRT